MISYGILVVDDIFIIKELSSYRVRESDEKDMRWE
jgi:hypothetical protein